MENAEKQSISAMFIPRADRKILLFASIVAIACISFGVVAALLLNFSTLLAIGTGIGIFFLLLFFRDPFLFLVFIIPFRMVLDFSGEFFKVSITESLSVSLSQVMGLFVFVVAILFFLTAKNIRSAARELFPLSIFFLWAVFSLVVSIAPWDTVRDIVRIFDVFALAFLAFVEVKSLSRFKRLLTVVLFSSIIPIIFGIFQYLSGSWYPNELVDLERIYGTFGHPNVFGLYLFAIMVSSFLFFRFFSNTANERIFSSSVGIVSFFLLFATLARVAWIAVFFFFLSVVFFKFRKLLLPVLMVPIFLFFVVPTIHDRIVEALTPSADSSVLWRINIWTDGLSKTLSENREIFGFGLNTFSAVVSDLHSEEFGSSEAHNDFVKFFVEGGIFGFLIFTFWMGWFVFRLFQMSTDLERNKQVREISFFLFLFLVSLILASLSDAVFKSTPIQWILWILLGSFFGMNSPKEGVVSSRNFIQKV